MNIRVKSGFKTWCFVLFFSGCLPALASNLILNGDFSLSFTDWSGTNFQSTVNEPLAPGGYFAEASALYQNVSTIPGQTYDITFSAAADLFLGPTLTLALQLNGPTVETIFTPPYTYNPGINRSDQMVWQQYTYLYTATSDSTLVEWVDQNTPYFGLADVSMTAVPEPSTSALAGTGSILFLLYLRSRRWVMSDG